MAQYLQPDGFGIPPPPSPSVYSVESTPQRFATPMSVNNADSITPHPETQPVSQGPTGATTPSSSTGSSSAVRNYSHNPNQRYFRSRRIQKGEIEHPWKLAKRDPREKWVTIIPLIGLALGLAVAGFLVYDGLRTIVNHEYKLILDEDWSQGFRTDIWHKEVTVGGFG